MGTKQLTTHQTQNIQKLQQIQAQTHQHLLCQVNQANPAKIQVNRKTQPVPAHMTQKQIPIPQVMTRNPSQVRPP